MMHTEREISKYRPFPNLFLLLTSVQNIQHTPLFNSAVILVHSVIPAWTGLTQS